jgi:hypothetical protein
MTIHAMPMGPEDRVTCCNIKLRELPSKDVYTPDPEVVTCGREKKVAPRPPGSYEIGSDNWPGLAKLVEEIGELNQVLGKIMGGGGDTTYWDGTDLRVNLTEELADVEAALLFFSESNLDKLRINGEFYGPYNARVQYKLGKFYEWHMKNGGLG